MQSVTPAFLQEITGSHQIATLAYVQAFNGSILLPLTVIDGSASADITNAIRRQCTLKLVDPNNAIKPSNAGDILSPLTGNELVLYRGVTYAAGGVELVPLGVFGIATAVVTDSPSGLEINLTGHDRARKVSRAKFTDVYTIATGTNAATAIQSIISSRVPGLTYNFTLTAVTMPTTVYQTGDDPWMKAQEIALALGCDLYFDVFGTCVLAPMPDPVTQQSVATYVEGATCTITTLDHAWSDDLSYNDVIVTGSGSNVATPVRAQVADTNPLSPTYVNGPYGDVVMTYSSPLVQTYAQAVQVGQAFVNRAQGIAEQLHFDQLVNPALDVNDSVKVTRTRAGVYGVNYVIDSITYPMLASNPMQVAARRRTA